MAEFGSRARTSSKTVVSCLRGLPSNMVRSQTLVWISLIFLVVLSAKGSNDEDGNNSDNGVARSPGSPVTLKHSNERENEQLIDGEYGVLQARETEVANPLTEDFCLIQFNDDNLPETRDDAKYFTLVNLTNYPSASFCGTGDLPLATNHSIVLIKYDITSCNISQQAATIEKRGPNVHGVLIQLPRGAVRFSDIKVNVNSTVDKRFIIAFISEKSVGSLFEDFNQTSIQQKRIEVRAFSPPHQKRSQSYPFDLSLLVIWVVAVFTVTVGSYWSGIVRAALYFRRKYELTVDNLESAGDESSGRRKSAIEEEPYLNISPMYIMFFVCCMGGMLVALYFFFKYLVYLIIGLFVLASILSVFACCEPLVEKLLPASLTKVSVPICSKKHPSPVYQIFVLIGAVSASFTWFFTRKEPYSWVLQDILGIFFAVNMLRTIRLPSFKICFVLLSLLFFYDIFFVFLTPLFTSSGDSVMVEVATGGSKGDDSGMDNSGGVPRETLPMVLKVPHLSIVSANLSDPLEVCYRDMRTYSYSLLGFGDILVPGLLVSYCHAFDLIHGIRGRPYFVTTSIFYGLGLIVTFAGLYLMNGIAQPALLYLVPFTIIPPIIIASCRGELKKLWTGPGDGTESRSSADSSPDKPSGGRQEATLLTDEDEDNRDQSSRTPAST